MGLQLLLSLWCALQYVTCLLQLMCCFVCRCSNICIYVCTCMWGRGDSKFFLVDFKCLGVTLVILTLFYIFFFTVCFSLCWNKSPLFNDFLDPSSLTCPSLKWMQCRSHYISLVPSHTGWGKWQGDLEVTFLRMFAGLSPFYPGEPNMVVQVCQ